MMLSAFPVFARLALVALFFLATRGTAQPFVPVADASRGGHLWVDLDNDNDLDLVLTSDGGSTLNPLASTVNRVKPPALAYCGGVTAR